MTATIDKHWNKIHITIIEDGGPPIPGYSTAKVYGFSDQDPNFEVSLGSTTRDDDRKIAIVTLNGTIRMIGGDHLYGLMNFQRVSKTPDWVAAQEAAWEYLMRHITPTQLAEIITLTRTNAYERGKRDGSDQKLGEIHKALGIHSYYRSDNDDE